MDATCRAVEQRSRSFIFHLSCTNFQSIQNSIKFRRFHFFVRSDRMWALIKIAAATPVEGFKNELEFPFELKLF